LIETANLNRNQTKGTIKATELDVNKKPELSRRQREELEKEKKRRNYMKAHEQGKTPEAKAQLERLQKIRMEREAAAKRKEEEVKAKEQAKAAARGRGRGKSSN